MRSSRRTAVAVLAVAALAPLACGDEGGPPPRERLEAADRATTGEGTAGFSLEATLRTGPDTVGTGMTITSRGAADLRTGRSRVETSLPGVGLSLTLLYDGDTVFVRMPGLLTGGEPTWTRQPARSFGPPGSGAGTGAAGFAGTPARLLDLLRGVEGPIERLGADTVRGNPVEGFAFRVSGERLWRGSGDPPAELRELRMPAAVWLDGGGRVRRLTLDVELGPALAAVREAAGDSLAAPARRALAAMGSGPGGSVELTVELFDFGTAVTTRPPDSVRVVDADSLGLEMLGRSGVLGSDGPGRDAPTTDRPGSAAGPGRPSSAADTGGAGG